MPFDERLAARIRKVEPKGLASEAALGKWVEIGVKFAASLPPK